MPNRRAAPASQPHHVRTVVTRSSCTRCCV
nr:MAG TPA: hypothetical protein [Caudoviricetes sp.]